MSNKRSVDVSQLLLMRVFLNFVEKRLIVNSYFNLAEVQTTARTLALAYVRNILSLTLINLTNQLSNDQKYPLAMIDISIIIHLSFIDHKTNQQDLIITKLWKVLVQIKNQRLTTTLLAE